MKTIDLTIRQFIQSPRAIVLLLRYGEEAIPFSPAVREIINKSLMRIFCLKSTFIARQTRLHLSTGALFRGDDGWMEHWVFRKRENPFSEGESRFFAYFIHHIACASNAYVLGIRTVHHIFSENDRLLRRYSVTEEPGEIDNFLFEKISIIQDNLKLSDNDLDPCHHSYTGRYMDNCASCPVRRHCAQKGDPFYHLKHNRKKG